MRKFFWDFFEVSSPCSIAILITHFVKMTLRGALFLIPQTAAKPLSTLTMQISPHHLNEEGIRDVTFSLKHLVAFLLLFQWTDCFLLSSR